MSFVPFFVSLDMCLCCSMKILFLQRENEQPLLLFYAGLAWNTPTSISNYFIQFYSVLILILFLFTRRRRKRMTKDTRKSYRSYRSNTYGHNHKHNYTKSCNKKRTNQNKPEQRQQQQQEEEESWLWTIGKFALKNIIIPVALTYITRSAVRHF